MRWPQESRIESVVGVCRRLPHRQFAKVEWRSADVVTSPLDELFEGADAVVHLAWAIQPARDRETVRAINVDGSRRVFAAVAAAGVPALVYASSVGAYAPGPKDRRVDESWPTTGIPSSFYSTHKAEVERLLDRFEVDHPEVRCVRLRPGLVFKREAASEVRRLFAGPLLPGTLVRPSLIPVVPAVKRLVVQAVHGDDLARHIAWRWCSKRAGPSTSPPSRHWMRRSWADCSTPVPYLLRRASSAPRRI